MIAKHAASFMRLLLGVASLNSVAAAEPGQAETRTPILSGEATRLDGTKESLQKYAGKVVLIVNTASRCGFTPQYKGLEALYRDLKGEDDGDLVVLGFPSNDFGGQEPGTNEQIEQFCESRFDVSFPMFERTPVLGRGAHPVYRRLAELPKPIGEPPTWNFTKYLIGRDGTPLARFGPRVAPDDERLRDLILTAIREPGPGDPPAEEAQETPESAAEASVY